MSSIAEREPIKVFYVTPHGYPELTGGLKRIFRNAVLLNEHGIEFIFVTVRRPDHKESEEVFKGVRTVRVALPDGVANCDPRKFLLRASLQMWKELKCPRAFVEMGVPGDWGTFVELVWCRMAGMRTVCGLTIMPEFSGRGISVLKERIGAGIKFRGFWRTLALSEEMKRQYSRRYFMPSRSLQVIPNGVDTERFCPLGDQERDDARSEMGFSSSEKLVVYVGSIVPRKRLRLVVGAWGEVFGACPEARLIIVGVEKERVTFSRGEQRFEFENEVAELYREIGKLEETESVKTVGMAENPSIYYQVADLFVFPSELEGMPNVLLEAMACGIPAIISDFVGKPEDGEEIGTEGEHYVKVVREAGSWSDSIIDALKSTELRHQVGSSARALIESQQSLEATVEGLESFYNSGR